MTYKFTLRGKIGLSWFNPSHAGNPAAGEYLTLTAGGVNTLSASGSGTSTLSLPPGRYMLRASIGGNKSSASITSSDALTYQWEVAGSLEGNIAGWDSYSASGYEKSTSECAEYVFSSESAVNVRLKVTAVVGTCTLTAAHSGVMIRGSQ